MAQLKYFMKTNLRNLFIYRKFTLINIIGLSLGLTVSLLILFYIRYETSFDNFNPNAKNIYRIVEKNIQDGTVGAANPLALNDVLKEDFPEVDKVVGIMRTWKDVKVEDRKFEDLKGCIVENNFFEMFHLPLVSGNPGTIFKSPFEAVVTHKLGRKIFGNGNPIGKTFEYEDHSFTVTGVIDDIPENSLLDFEFFLSDKFRYVSYPDLNERWYEFGLYTFLTFKGKTPPENFEQKLAGIENRYYPDFMKNRFNYLLTDFKGSHLIPEIQGDIVPSVSPVYLWMLSGIAFGILIIACFNFINISIAGSGKRNIETGIKKVNGASLSHLIGNFFAEITLVVFISLLLSFASISFLMPWFEKLTGKNIAIDFTDPILWVGTIGFCIFTILVSGLYPSIVLSRPSPVKVLLQNKNRAQNKMTFQKSFVILQFTLTIVLGIVLLFIFKQVHFMQNHETGFDKENLITMSARSLGRNGNERMKNVTLFIHELENYQSQYGYGKASVTEFVPGFGFRNLFKIYEEGNTVSEGTEMLSCDVDENFAEVFGINVRQGRFFSKNIASDFESGIVLNESALKKLGWKSTEGKTIGLITSGNKKKVLGVIDDINVKSLQYPVEPMVYQFGRHHNYPGYITLRLNPEKKAESLAFIKQKWTELFPDTPFSVESISEKYKSAYGEEKRLAKITGVFSVLAILLSLSGIFALSALHAERRIKEIGIRKVNGARVSEILSMLNKDFIKWVAIAFICAIPVAYYTMNKWLAGFAYKTGLCWWIFALAGLLALGIALLTVSWQSWRAATRNPVEALRYE